ncbi:MAG: hypothetical protein HQL37_10590 [Alphaproteobacteria bacterium]|nr:hypothetical protein [Alphaproteobacteria bacterium]
MMYRYRDAYVGFGIALLISIIIFMVPPNFLLSKIGCDALNYFVMAREILKLHFDVFQVENGSVLLYASGVSYVYALAMIPFSEFSQQLLAIQFANMIMMGAFVSLWIAYLRQAFPSMALWVLLAFIGGEMLLDVEWYRRIALPNTDALACLLTIGAILVARPLVAEPLLSRTEQRWRLAAIVLIAGLGFYVKMTLVTLAIAPLLLMLPRLGTVARVVTLTIATITLALMAAFYMPTMAAYWQGLLAEDIFSFGDPSPATLVKVLVHCGANLFFSVLPDQIVPNYLYLYRTGVALEWNDFHAQTYTPKIIAAMAGGVVISAFVVSGAVRSWRQYRMEIILLLIVLPVFAIVTNATYRYVSPYRPIFWIFFLTEAQRFSTVLSKRYGKLDFLRPAMMVLGAAGVGAILFICLRIGLRGETNVPAMVNGVATVYGDVAVFLKREPSKRTRIVYINFGGESVSTDRWLLVSRIPQRIPDATLAAEAGTVRTLAVLVCAKLNCGDLDATRHQLFDMLHRFRPLDFHLIFSERNAVARAEIYDISQVQP